VSECFSQEVGSLEIQVLSIGDDGVDSLLANVSRLPKVKLSVREQHFIIM
jgi:hypothetical protein